MTLKFRNVLYSREEHEQRNKFLLLNKKLKDIGWDLREFIDRGHEHALIDSTDSAVCKICEQYFGWWCDKSPNKYCEYDESYDLCIYCSDPYERK